MRNEKGMITLLILYYRPLNGQRELEEQICRETAEIYKNNRVVIVGYFNIFNLDWDCHNAMSSDGVEFVIYIQKSFLMQYIEVPSMERVKPPTLGKQAQQVTEVSIGDHFGSSEYTFKMFLNIYGKGHNMFTS